MAEGHLSAAPHVQLPWGLRHCSATLCKAGCASAPPAIPLCREQQRQRQQQEREQQGHPLPRCATRRGLMGGAGSGAAVAHRRRVRACGSADMQSAHAAGLHVSPALGSSHLGPPPPPLLPPPRSTLTAKSCSACEAPGSQAWCCWASSPSGEGWQHVNVWRQEKETSRARDGDRERRCELAVGVLRPSTGLVSNSMPAALPALQRPQGVPPAAQLPVPLSGWGGWVGGVGGGCASWCGLPILST